MENALILPFKCNPDNTSYQALMVDSFCDFRQSALFSLRRRCSKPTRPTRVNPRPSAVHYVFVMALRCSLLRDLNNKMFKIVLDSTRSRLTNSAAHVISTKNTWTVYCVNLLVNLRHSLSVRSGRRLS